MRASHLPGYCDWLRDEHMIISDQSEYSIPPAIGIGWTCDQAPANESQSWDFVGTTGAALYSTGEGSLNWYRVKLR